MWGEGRGETRVRLDLGRGPGSTASAWPAGQPGVGWGRGRDPEGIPEGQPCRSHEPSGLSLSVADPLKVSVVEPDDLFQSSKLRMRSWAWHPPGRSPSLSERLERLHVLPGPGGGSGGKPGAALVWPRPRGGDLRGLVLGGSLPTQASVWGSMSWLRLSAGGLAPSPLPSHPGQI